MLQYTDRISMSQGIECRVPLLDDVLFETSFRLKNKFKYKENNSRVLLKKILDKKINFHKISQNKFKNTIVDPQREWFKTHLKDFIFDNINSSDFKNMGLFNQKYILQSFDKFLKNEINTSFHFMQIVSFYRFYKIFFINKYIKPGSTYVKKT